MNDSENPSIVDVQFGTGQALIDYLTKEGRLDLLGDAENNFRKVLLLSVASYFEKEITSLILSFAEVNSRSPLVTGLVKSKAIDRQYFTYFDWDDGRNANRFFALFGVDFKDKMAKQVKDDPALNEAIRAFLQLGRDRNHLVHRNFAEYNLEATAEDIKSNFDRATYFVQKLRQELGHPRTLSND